MTKEPRLCILLPLRLNPHLFCSVHTYDTVYKILCLVAKNILVRTYFMDSTLSAEFNIDQPAEEAEDLMCKFAYYISSLVTGLLIFRGIEKEWRQIIQWAAVVFFLIESVAFGIQSTLYPDSFTSLPFTLTVICRVTFISFYLVSLSLYVRDLQREEKEDDYERQWKIEPSYIYGYNKNGSSRTDRWGPGSLSFIGFNGTIPRPTSIPKFKLGNDVNKNYNHNTKKFNNLSFSRWNKPKQESGFYFERFPKYENY